MCVKTQEQLLLTSLSFPFSSSSDEDAVIGSSKSALLAGRELLGAGSVCSSTSISASASASSFTSSPSSKSGCDSSVFFARFESCGLSYLFIKQ